VPHHLILFLILPVNLVGSQLGCFLQTLEGQQQLHPHLGEGQSLHLQEEKNCHAHSFYNNLTMEKYQESLATKVSKNKKLNIPNAD
jgi:hypothetical protein